jgi:signal transduction histidine kinase
MPQRWLLVAATLLVAALAILGVLQYRWIGELGEGEERRERGAIEFAARHFVDDTDREVARAVGAFQAASRDEDAIGRRYDEWLAAAHDRRIVANMYVADPDGRLSRWDAASRTLVAIEWPPQLEEIRAFARDDPFGPRSATRRPPIFDRIPAAVAPLRPNPPRPAMERRRDEAAMPPPARTQADAPPSRKERGGGDELGGGAAADDRPPFGGPPPPRDDGGGAERADAAGRPDGPPPFGGPPPAPRGDGARGELGGRAGADRPPPFGGPPPPPRRGDRPRAEVGGAARADDRPPLGAPPPPRADGGRAELAGASRTGGHPPTGTPPPQSGDRHRADLSGAADSRGELGADARADGRPSFGGAPRDAAPPQRAPERPSILIIVFDRSFLISSFFPELARRYFAAPYDVSVVEGGRLVYGRASTDAAELVLPMFANRGPEAADRDRPARWSVAVHRRGGPVAAAVAESRRRNVAIALAVLGILAASFALVAVLARRADRLRRQQLEFVAGITHELNTPLAALRSAGQNLADGIIAEPSQIARYGTMIVKESRRLSDMVGQVLDFAGMQARSAPRRVDAVEVDAVVREAVAHCRWLAEENGVAIEETIGAELPRVNGDAAALTRAVQNLIANAIRHGKDGAWVGVRAERSGSGVAITVEDRGPGVGARDLPHLFEPFYRGANAAARGTGLGLTIVRQIAETHGGTIDVARRRQRGAAFTLQLPAGAA